MAHIALYREFRPKTFDEVIGQDHIVKTLKNQIKTGNLSHAYLFCGTRGTGKTSCAKIFARAVNCLNPQDGSPCGECEVCKAVMSGANLDIVEIDAASNNRVDEIRDLREKVSYLPSVCKYKVYIIDEVHMLTDSAFNALLKTLEEPPSHIIFILATTEPQKLPATILSRCMRFDFKLVTEQDLVLHLKNIFAKTGTKYEEDALKLIAKAGKGSVRDTLSVAEICKAFSADNITYDSVSQCLGLTDEKTLFDVSSAIIDRDGGKILEILEELFSAGKNISVFIDDLCEYFKNLMVAKLSNSLSSGIPEHILRDYQTLAQKTDEKFLLDCLNTLCNAQNAIKFCTSEKVFAQTTLLSLLYNNNMEIEMLKQKVKNLENSLGENNAQKKTIIDCGVVEKQNVESKVDEKHTQSDSQIEIKTIKKQTQGEKTKDLQMQNAQNGSQQVDLQEKSVSQNISASAKEILGGLVKHARQNGEMMLFAGMNDVDSASICDGCFCVECKTDMCVELIEEHKEFILNYLKDEFGINNISCSVEVDKEKEKQKKLKELFDGKIKFI